MECPKLDPVELALEQRASEIFDRYYAVNGAEGGKWNPEEFHDILVRSNSAPSYKKAVYACLNYDYDQEMKEVQDGEQGE
jgi:hypothetical protein